MVLGLGRSITSTRLTIHAKSRKRRWRGSTPAPSNSPRATIADEVEADSAQVAKARFQVDVRKWHAGKLAPKKYGDRISHDVTRAQLPAVDPYRRGWSAARGVRSTASIRRRRGRSTRWQRKHCMGALIGEAHSRRTARHVLSWSDWRHFEGPANASIQNNSGLSQGLADPAAAG
jgi:hypothetical protein